MPHARLYDYGQRVGIILLAAVLSLLALDSAARLHPDEAFYLTIARDAAVKGDWSLRGEPLDKPPLTYYQNALAFTLFVVDADANGVLHLDIYKGEFAGRIGAVMWSVILVAAGMAWARSLGYGRRVVLLVGMLLALSPFRIAFAATAFTDMPMLALGVLALWQATTGNATISGVWFALSLTAKPQTIFYLPLIFALLLLASPPTTLLAYGRQLLRWCVPIVVISGAVLLWDAARVQSGATSFLALGQARYTPTTLTPLTEIPDRLSTWWSHGRWLLGNGWLTSVGLLIGIIHTLRQRQHVSALFGGWILAFIAAHLFLTLNLFDRNQLVLLPVVVMWVTPGLVALWDALKRPIIKRPAVAAGSVLLVGVALWSAAGYVPIGGDDGSHRNMDALARHLNGKPVATVIYDRWLDWELDYYMGAWTNKRRVYYPTPAQLAQGALALDEKGTRYIVIPTDEPAADWLNALRAAGFRAQRDREWTNVAVYALYPPAP